MIDKKNNEDNRAAILCEHVANQGYPILRAIRDGPLEDVDSGWQFLCNSVENENKNNAQVWAVSEVLELEPSLSEYLHLSPGTILTRENREAQWKVIVN